MTTLCRDDYVPNNVIAFPRARVLHGDLELEQALRRCRLVARLVGCTQREIDAVERNATVLLDLGHTPHDTIGRCRSLAALIVSKRTPPESA